MNVMTHLETKIRTTRFTLPMTVLVLLGLAALGSCSGSKSTPNSPRSPNAGAPTTTEVSASSDLDQPTPLDPRVRTGVLANGLTYYVLEHKKPENRAALWLGVNAGSVLEDDDQKGLAHFVEHMAFNGTKNFEKAAIVNYFESIGMRFGADLNAYTRFNETVYTIKVPTDKQVYLDTGMAILRDWADRISFDPIEVDKERGVVTEEWRLRQGAGERMSAQLLPIMFKGSRYANRRPVGDIQIIKNAPVAALKRFYTDWYRPELMAVIAVGDFDGAQIESQIRKTFADIKKSAHPRERKPALVPSHDELRVAITTDNEQPRTFVQVHNKLAHRREQTVGDYRDFVVQRMMANMLNARLRELGEQANASFQMADARISDLTRTADGFFRFAVAKTGQSERALEDLLVEVERARRYGFTDSEIERTRKNMIRRAEQAAANYEKVSGRVYAAELLRHYFQGEQMPGRVAEETLVKRFANTVTNDDFKRLLAASTTDRGRLIALSGPSHEPMPSEARVRELVGEVSQRDLKPYTDKLNDQPLMVVKPAAGAVIGENLIAEIGVTEWKLSNGARVVVKPTNFKNNEIYFSAFSVGGTSLVSDRDFDSARFASQIVGRSGVGEFNRIQLRKILTGKIAAVGATIGELEEGMRGSTAPTDLETMMQLIHLRFTVPRKDEKAFATWKARRLDAVRNRRLQPESAFFEDASAAYNMNHRRRRPVTAETIKAVDLDKAYDFYRERFGDASDFTFTFVGNIELSTLKPLVEQYLASLPAEGRKETWRDVNVRHPRGIKRLKVKRGTEPKASVFLQFHGRQKWSKEAANDMRMLNEALRIRLREILREDMGGVYGVSAFGSIRQRPKQERTLSITFGCDPARINELKDALFAEMKALQKNGIGDDYIAKIKEKRVRSYETLLKSNSYWIRSLNNAYRFSEDPRDILEHQKWTDAISSERIRNAARRYIKMGQYFLATLKPEKKVTEKK